jgi:hypothetical protein
MGFLPFVNQGGQRRVRWHRLILTWIAVLLACSFGTAAASYALLGEWWSFAHVGLAVGVFSSAWVTVLGFTLPVEQLPPVR